MKNKNFNFFFIFSFVPLSTGIEITGILCKAMVVVMLLVCFFFILFLQRCKWKFEFFTNLHSFRIQLLISAALQFSVDGCCYWMPTCLTVPCSSFFFLLFSFSLFFCILVHSPGILYLAFSRNFSRYFA